MPRCGASGQPFCCHFLPAESLLLGLCSRPLIPCSRTSRKTGNFCLGPAPEGHVMTFTWFRVKNVGTGRVRYRVSGPPRSSSPAPRPPLLAPSLPHPRSSSSPSPPPASLLLLLPPFSSCVDRSLPAPAPLGPRQPDRTLLVRPRGKRLAVADVGALRPRGRVGNARGGASGSGSPRLGVDIPRPPIRILHTKTSNENFHGRCTLDRTSAIKDSADGTYVCPWPLRA